MKTVVIREGFTAYPNSTLREFVAGDEVEVSDDFGELIIGKGLAREKAPEAGEGAGRAKKEKQS